MGPVYALLAAVLVAGAAVSFIGAGGGGPSDLLLLWGGGIPAGLALCAIVQLRASPAFHDWVQQRLPWRP